MESFLHPFHLMILIICNRGLPQTFWQFKSLSLNFVRQLCKNHITMGKFPIFHKCWLSDQPLQTYIELLMCCACHKAIIECIGSASQSNCTHLEVWRQLGFWSCLSFLKAHLFKMGWNCYCIKMVQNGHFYLPKTVVTHQNDGHDGSQPQGPSLCPIWQSPIGMKLKSNNYNSGRSTQRDSQFRWETEGRCKFKDISPRTKQTLFPYIILCILKLTKHIWEPLRSTLICFFFHLCEIVGLCDSVVYAIRVLPKYDSSMPDIGVHRKGYSSFFPLTLISLYRAR